MPPKIKSKFKTGQRDGGWDSFTFEELTTEKMQLPFGESGSCQGRIPFLWWWWPIPLKYFFLSVVAQTFCMTGLVPIRTQNFYRQNILVSRIKISLSELLLFTNKLSGTAATRRETCLVKVGWGFQLLLRRGKEWKKMQLPLPPSGSCQGRIPFLRWDIPLYPLLLLHFLRNECVFLPRTKLVSEKVWSSQEKS